jgi:pimeloyl-ACP methyl ester carboxylesterase
VLAHLDSGGEGPAIVLVHGGGDNAATWHELLEPLSAIGRVIAPDLLGHGWSATVLDDGPIDLHTSVGDLLDALGVIERPLLVGHSLGAPVVLALARQRPAHGLLLLDGSPHKRIFEPPEVLDEDAQRRDLEASGYGAIRSGPELEELARSDAHPAQVHRGHVVVGDDRYQRRPTIEEAVRLARKGVRVDNPYRDLQLYAEPAARALYLNATRGPAAEVRDKVDDLLSGSDVRWLDSSHSLHWDRRQDVIDAIHALL